jgi:hypothetical protein
MTLDQYSHYTDCHSCRSYRHISSCVSKRLYAMARGVSSGCVTNGCWKRQLGESGA